MKHAQWKGVTTVCCSGEGFCPDRAAHLSQKCHEGDWPTVHGLQTNSQEVEEWCRLKPLIVGLYTWHNWWVISISPTSLDASFVLTQNVVILGDLNAGCSYVTIKGWRALRLRSDPNFHWLIGDEQDTTVRDKTHCAYDRSGSHWVPLKYITTIILHIVADTQLCV